MTDRTNNHNIYTGDNRYIANKISSMLDTLRGVSTGIYHNKTDMYSMTGHEPRYEGLNLLLGGLSLPLVAVVKVIKTATFGVVVVSQILNIPAIMLNKMDQSIANKILKGMQDINQDALQDISTNILRQWQEDSSLVIQEEHSLFDRFKDYICEHIPLAARIRDFWVNSGIHYSKEQLEEQQRIKMVTKEIFKLAYNYGKNGKDLHAADIYKHFKDIGTYKEPEAKLLDNQDNQNNEHSDDITERANIIDNSNHVSKVNSFDTAQASILCEWESDWLPPESGEEVPLLG